MATQTKQNEAMQSSAARPLPLRIRPDLITERQSYQGRDYWVVKDPLAMKFFRFEEEEYRLLTMMDGSASPDRIKRDWDYEFAPQKISLQELYQFIGMLYRSSLLVSDSPGQGIKLQERHATNEQKKFQQAMSNVLAFRFRGFDPDRLLDRMSKYTNWFFTWPASIAAMMLGVAALALILTQFETFQAKLPGFHDFFAAKNWIWLMLVMGVTKVLHEFGHGLACKRFGGQCHEMGVMLLVLTPCLYVNVSDSWMLKSKWKRAFIAAAGMYVELVLASVAVFVWWFSQPGIVNQLALNLIFVSSVSTLLFNANPLLRYDGYYILADLLEIPNLRQKASTILQRTAGTVCLGIESPEDPFLPARNKWMFILYAVCAALYRWLIMFSIFWFLYGVLEPYGLKIIGQAIALSALYGLVVMPLVRIYKFFNVPGRLMMIKKGRAALTLVVATALIAFILALPVPHYVYCCFYIQPADAENVYVDVPGTMSGVFVEKNQAVRSGQELILLQSPELDEIVANLQGSVNVAAARLQANKSAAAFDRLSAQRTPILDEELTIARQRLVRRQEEYPRLIVRSPIDGFIIDPPYIPPPKTDSGALGQWYGSPLEPRNVGAFMDQKTLVARVVPDLSRHTAILAIDQSDIEFVQSGQDVELSITQLPGELITARTENISPVQMKSVPKSLSSRFGGHLVTTVNDDGDDIPQSSTFKVSVPFASDEHAVIGGASGVAKIRTGSTTIGQRIWRLALKTFRFDL